MGITAACVWAGALELAQREMSMLYIERVSDAGGGMWVLFEHGRFHQPIVILTDHQAQRIASEIASKVAVDTDAPMLVGDLARRVKERRTELRISQAEYAAKLGVSRNYLSMIERGKADNISLGIYRTIMADLQGA